MKLICPKYLSCTIDDCPHKVPHHHKVHCDRCCAGSDGVFDSQCEETLNSIRERKLKKLKPL